MTLDVWELPDTRNWRPISDVTVTLDGDPYPRSPLRFAPAPNASDDSEATVEEAIKYPHRDQRGSDEGVADVLRGDIRADRAVRRRGGGAAPDRRRRSIATTA